MQVTISGPASVVLGDPVDLEATVSDRPAGTDDAKSGYVWSFKKKDAAAFTDIAGATEATCAVAATADHNGATFKAKFTAKAADDSELSSSESAGTLVTVKAATPTLGPIAPANPEVAPRTKIDLAVAAPAAGVKLQWSRRKPHQAAFTAIEGKTAAKLTTNTLTPDDHRTTFQVEAIAEVDGLEPSDPVTQNVEVVVQGTPWSKDPRRLIEWALLGGVAGVAALGWFHTSRSDNDGHEWALVFASLLILIALGMVKWLGGNKGMLNPIVGTDNRVSTSKTVTALWSVAIAYGIGYLLGLVTFDSRFAVDDVIKDEFLDNYLLLLGGPFAALVLSKAIVSEKVQTGNIQKIPSTEPEYKNGVTNDAGQTDLVDVQYLVFNIVAIGYFAFQTGRSSTLAEMPSPLIGLTLVGASAYLGNKAVEREAPRITSITPSTVNPGDEIAIRGNNLFVDFDPTKVDELTVPKTTVELVGVAGSLELVGEPTSTLVRAKVGDAVPAANDAYHLFLTTNAGYRTEDDGVRNRVMVK